MIRFFPKIIGSVISLAILTSCTSRYQPEQVLSDYTEGLSRSRFVSVEVPKFVSPALYPPLQQRQKALSVYDISLLDFLSLQQCDVGFLVGKKNSVLGRVMPNSQRFLYEIEIVRAIENCHIADKGLVEALSHVAAVKRRELSIAFANAVFNGNEASEFFSLSNGFLPMENSIENYQPLLASLRSLKNIGQNLTLLPHLKGETFENNLKALADSEYAGQLLYSLAQLTRYLNAVSVSIESLKADICGPSAIFLQQQFKQHYVKIIQPYMAKINSSAYQVLPIIEDVSVSSAPLSEVLREYLSSLSLSQRGGLWNLYQNASQRHAKAWSQLFKRCGMSLMEHS